MRIYIYAILIVFLVQGKLYSKVIKGVILNKTTNAVLPFASISIKNKYFGIVANENGEFDFHYKNEFKNDTLVISKGFLCP
jgi:hypothetical protein